MVIIVFSYKQTVENTSSLNNPALKSYFLSQNQIPIEIKSFFEDPLNENYLWFIYSLMYIFHSKIEIMEKENNSIWEILYVLLLVENARTKTTRVFIHKSKRNI
jgi:hypothetical protein